MFKKLLHQVLPARHRRKQQSKHCIHHDIALDIQNRAALKVLDGLHQAGFQAYLVGGAVRDLLLNKIPKDFDVATDATPEQVTRVFRRSRMIGRRFQIVHVSIGAEIIEVSTFRGGEHVKQNELGRIMQDNAYGSIEQDAERRDFTCNALYYDVKRQQILDYHHGVRDIQARRLVMIGEPSERYHEDPVRILRAVRLSGKLGFTVDEATAQPIASCSYLLRKEPVARLFDELLKILFSGCARGCLKQLTALNINQAIHPLLQAMYQASVQKQPNIAELALQQTDNRLQHNQSVSIGFVLAALFWEQLTQHWKIQQQGNMSAAAAMNVAIKQLHDEVEHSWGIPQRYCATMREIWALQPQFTHQRGARPYRLLAQPRFRAAYDFLLLRAQQDSNLAPIAQWWTQFQRADDSERKAMTANAPIDKSTSPNKKRRRSRHKNKGNTTS